MRKRTVMIAIFFIGLLLMGVGGGISFAEFSSLRYGGERNLCGELTTVTLHKTVPGDVKTISLRTGRYDLDNIRIEADPAMDKDQLSIEILCRQEIITPYIEEQEAQYGEEDGESEETVYFLDYRYRRSHNDLSSFFQAKDILLDGLKNRTVYSFSDNYVQEIVVKAAPELSKRIIAN